MVTKAQSIAKKCIIMTLEITPPSKRLKPNYSIDEIKSNIDCLIKKLHHSEKSLEAVLVDDIYKTIPPIKVFVGCINNVKDTSKTILLLNQKIPLKDLQHLKRAKGRNIIICKTQAIKPLLTIEEFIEEHVEDLKNVFQSYQEVVVPSSAPKVKRQYQEANSMWPCNFHPNLNLEKLVNNEFFSPDQLKQHKKFMKVVIEITKWYMEKENICCSDNIFNYVNATVVVDPESESIVAVSFDNRRKHPIQHSVMLAIDNVARTQNGGVWQSAHDSTFTGIDKEVLSYLQAIFPEVKFGHKDVITLTNGAGDKEGPYLCTGYYVYVLKEPCFMCAMALVHARVKRVFFFMDNLQDGALKSRTKLQAVRSLNHHFEVFTGF